MPANVLGSVSTRPSPRLPGDLRWSNVWRNGDGDFVQHDREIPIDRQWRPAGQLWLCPTKGCHYEHWTFTPQDERPCCSDHPVQLLLTKLDPDDSDPVTGARDRLTAWVAQRLERRRQLIIDAATVRLEAAQAAVSQAAKSTAADMRGHMPSLTASAAVAVTDIGLAVADPLLAELVGLVTMSFGAVLAYVTVYATQRWRARRVGVELVGRAGRRVRVRARQVALGMLAAGVYGVVVGLLGVDPATLGGDAALLLAPLLAWTVNRRHWEALWETRRRLRDLARQRAEEAARRAAAEAARLQTTNAAAAPAPTSVDEVVEGPLELEMGRRMAARWAEIARSDTVPAGFLMRRTWIIPEETRELTIPDGDSAAHIGWEYAIESEPGVLVSRIAGTPSPLLSARDWLASMLGIQTPLVMLTDRPDNQINRALLSITDRLALGNSVNWKGPNSVRREGAVLLGHVGADMNGRDIFEPIHVPGQLTGGMTVGHSGGGKSAGARVSLLNDLAAGIFPMLYDPVKSLGDFSEFVGIFPLGCTPEHRDVMLQTLHAERDRRNKAINGRMTRDRHGRVRPEPGVFQVGRDGPQIRSYWDEFHRNAADKTFLASFLDLMRVQRAVAMDSEVYTQGGGLQDLGDSVVRGLLNQVRMRLYRMPDNLARLAGYSGDYMPSQLPRVPGACLLITEGVPVIPLRGAWVTRDDEDGCVYDYLYAPDGSPLLVAPKLPADTLEVFRREGLLDLWNLGKGPNGLANLIGDTPSAPPLNAIRTADTAATSAAGPLAAADVILAIASTQPGCPRSTLDNHPVWNTAPAGGKVPVPSTISRAALRLVNEGLLKRDDNAYEVTPAGQAKAAAAAEILFGSGPESTEAAADAGTDLASPPWHLQAARPGTGLLGNDVLAVLADAALTDVGPVDAGAILLGLRSRGWNDLDRSALTAHLAGMRDHNVVVCVGDKYELSVTLVADLAEQFAETAGEGDEL